MPALFLRRSSPLRNSLCLLFGLGSIWLGYNFVRWRMLLDKGQMIVVHSAQFSRDYWVGDKDKPVLTYLAMGDSIAAGWGAEGLEGTYPYMVATAVAARGYRVHVRNVAVGGAQIWDVCRVQLPSLSLVRPDLVTLTIGANDATRGTDDGDCIRGYRTIFASLQNSTARTIIATNIPDMYQAPALPFPFAILSGRNARRINVLLYGEAASTRIQVLDLWGHGKLVYRKDHNLYAADLFHPSSKGYAVWAKLFVKSLPSHL